MERPEMCIGQFHGLVTPTPLAQAAELSLGVQDYIWKQEITRRLVLPEVIRCGWPEGARTVAAG
jgi:hypothetical protein